MNKRPYQALKPDASDLCWEVWVGIAGYSGLLWVQLRGLRVLPGSPMREFVGYDWWSALLRLASSAEYSGHLWVPQRDLQSGLGNLVLECVGYH